MDIDQIKDDLKTAIKKEKALKQANRIGTFTVLTVIWVLVFGVLILLRFLYHQFPQSFPIFVWVVIGLFVASLIGFLYSLFHEIKITEEEIKKLAAKILKECEAADEKHVYHLDGPVIVRSKEQLYESISELRFILSSAV